MENPLSLSLWLGVVLYASAGLFGVVMLHNTAPMTPDVSGYGIVYSRIAVSDSGN
jgi:hypothetical protein